MKTILVGNSYDDLFLFSDSSIGRDVMPLFIPDFHRHASGLWRCDATLAFRVGRLGKNIPEKFAMRYIDAVGVVAILSPTSPYGAPLYHASYPSWLSIMDSAVTTGEWMELPEDPLTVECDGKEFTVDNINDLIEPAVSLASSIATIKTGDIIIPDSQRIEIHLDPDTQVTASINGEPMLHLKIK